MNGKERVRIAMDRGVPDRVPWGEFAIDYDTVERIVGHETYVRAKARCQLAIWEGRRDEMVQSLREDGIALFRALEDTLDLINLNSMYFAKVPPKGYRVDAPTRVDGVTYAYPDGRVLKYSEITGDFAVVEAPQRWTRQFREGEILADVSAEPEDESCYEVIDAIVAEFGDRKYVVGPMPMAPEFPLLGGMERGLLEMAVNPGFIDGYVKHGLTAKRIQMGSWRNRGYDATLTATDFGAQHSSLTSPAMFRRFCLPGVAANVLAAHEAGLKYIKHTCGNNWSLLPMFAEAGVDCYQSVQESAGMDTAEVKRRYGDSMAVWGGVQVEHLVSGTPEDVREDVRRAMRLAEQGGFILGASHSIAVGTRYDNFMAMLDEFVKLRDR